MYRNMKCAVAVAVAGGRWTGGGGGRRRRCSVAASASAPASALEVQCTVHPETPAPEPLREPRAGSAARSALARELRELCRTPARLPTVVGWERADLGEERAQPMPFEHARTAARFVHAPGATVERAVETAVRAARGWEATPVDARCRLLERAAALMAGEHRARIVAAAIVSQAATAIRAELDVRQLVDQIRYDCMFARDLTRSRCVVEGGASARNCNQYHGLEGFWAAISPSEGVAAGAYPALAPVLMGNAVVWKPSDRAALVAYRVLEALEAAGLPPGVVNFLPADEGLFLDTVVKQSTLAGVCFGGSTAALEEVWRRVGENVERYGRFPRVTGLASGTGFHVVHSSADLPAAVAGTARAAFEMAGQKATSCSRVYVAESIFERFVEGLGRVARALIVTHPLDYRCFMSALGSEAAWRRAGAVVERAARDDGVRTVCGGRLDATVGWYAEPTVYAVRDATHDLLTGATRAPLVALHAFRDEDLAYLEWAAGRAPLATSGAVYAADLAWTRAAVHHLRHHATALVLNGRCSELQPGQQALGGSKKSGTGAKMGSISCLLQYCSERSLREVCATCADVTYSYMDEVPPPPATARLPPAASPPPPDAAHPPPTPEAVPSTDKEPPAAGVSSI